MFLQCYLLWYSAAYRPHKVTWLYWKEELCRPPFYTSTVLVVRSTKPIPANKLSKNKSPQFVLTSLRVLQVRSQEFSTDCRHFITLSIHSHICDVASLPNVNEGYWKRRLYYVDHSFDIEEFKHHSVLDVRPVFMDLGFL